VLSKVNLSCNFFKGSFDIPSYIKFVDKFWRHLEKLEQSTVDNETKQIHEDAAVAKPSENSNPAAPKKRKGK
jgi:hypothetical protein